MATFLAKFFKIGLEERQERQGRWARHRTILFDVSLMTLSTPLLLCPALLYVRLSSTDQSVVLFIPSSLLMLCCISPMQNLKKDEEYRHLLSDEKQVLRLKGYSETDFQSAMTKLTEAALRYDRNGALPAGLRDFGFNDVTMPPHVFKVINRTRLSWTRAGWDAKDCRRSKSSRK